MGVAGLWRGFSRVGGACGAARRLRAILGLLVARSRIWSRSEAESRQAQLSGDGRAQRGLDLSKEHLTYRRAVSLA
jgi:hypothetical protein